jgi:gluconate 2-dehydrogenase alpha chain
LTTHAPLALATRRWTVRAGCYVLDIPVDRNGRARGIRYLDPEGNEQFQPADLVVVSGYTLSNVRALLLSTSHAHPHGIGNDRGQVGRNATHQLNATLAGGTFAEKLRSYMANTATLQVICDFQEDNFDHSGLGFIGGSMIYSSPGERAPVNDAASFPHGSRGSGQPSTVKSSAPSKGPKPRNWGREWKEALRDWDRYAGVLIQGDSLPYEHNRFDLDPNYRDSHGRPLLRFTFDWTDNERAHVRYLSKVCGDIMRAMRPKDMSVSDELQPYDVVNYKTTHVTGGAIMGDDPSTSVTNSYGQVWDTPNVYVTGAALFPFNPGFNPTGTVGALAYRAADAVAGADDPSRPLED